MSQAALLTASLDDYLTFERVSETKHEYHDGSIVAMAGGTGPHSLIAGRLITSLNMRVVSRGCSVFNSDMRIYIDANRRSLYPDISALCGTPEYRDATRDVLLNPALIVEVLSSSTEGYDRGRKLALYMALPSVVEIALVSQEEVRVDKFTRQPAGIWHFQSFSGMDAVMPLVSLGTEVRLGDFYEGIELAPPSPEPGAERVP